MPENRFVVNFRFISGEISAEKINFRGIPWAIFELTCSFPQLSAFLTILAVYCQLVPWLLSYFKIKKQILSLKILFEVLLKSLSDNLVQVDQSGPIWSKLTVQPIGQKSFNPSDFSVQEIDHLKKQKEHEKQYACMYDHLNISPCQNFWLSRIRFILTHFKFKFSVMGNCLMVNLILYRNSRISHDC